MSTMRVEEQSEEQQVSTTVSKNTNSNGYENDGDELNEQKKENITLKVFLVFEELLKIKYVGFYQTKVQVLETANVQLVEEKKVQEKV
jgi:hypothetical protein